MRVNRKGNCGDSGVFVKSDPDYKRVDAEAPQSRGDYTLKAVRCHNCGRTLKLTEAGSPGVYKGARVPTHKAPAKVEGGAA